MGDKIKDIELNLTPIKTSEKLKTEFLEKIKNYLEGKNIYEENKDLLNDPNIYPDYFPIFYALKSDPEGNMSFVLIVQKIREFFLCI